MALSKPDLDLPPMELNKATGEWEFAHGGDGWGWLLVSRATPTAGSAWTDTGERRERRQLKQRAKGEVRPTPSPPPLTRLPHAHLRQFGTAADGRPFRNLTGGQLAESTVNRVWDKARKAVLTQEEHESVLCKRPYDLRHACVSFQLAAGVPVKQVAEWNGHSLTVLLENLRGDHRRHGGQHARSPRPGPGPGPGQTLRFRDRE
ncbi:hypothetical protein ACPZ19_49985 [Amycolatopsis lurida]